MQPIFSMVLLFFVGSGVGWIMEFFFRRYFAPEKKWCNPGFLTGPCLPIYGFGAVILLHVSLPLYDRPAALFFASMAAATVFE